MKLGLHFRHNDFYFGLLLLLLCLFCVYWYFSFVLMLLDVNFLFLHFFYVVVVLALPSCIVIGAWCRLLLLFLSHYSSRTIFLHYCSSHFHCSLGFFHVVDPLTLPLLLCCHPFHTALLALLLFSRCHSFHVAPIAF